MIKFLLFLSFIFAFLFENAKAQSALDSTQKSKEFINLDEALKKPENVYRLNLSNQSLKIADTIWSKFSNLQYLSFKNAHLTQIPTGIGYLKNLNVLDLSGNDFELLPSTFTNLTKLQELYLNDEKNFQFERVIPILSKLPNLKSLHLENDELNSLPNNFYMLNQIESLYLNNNRFEYVPVEIGGLKNLKFLDFHDNILRTPIQDNQIQSFGFKIRF